VTALPEKGTDLVSSTAPRGFRRRLTRRAAAAATALTAAGLLLATPALGSSGTSAAPTDTTPAPPAKVAIISPLLSIMSFGTTFGLPEVCITGAGAMLSFANTVPGATAAIGPITSQFASQCGQLAAAGGVSIAQLNQNLAPLSGINSAANPYIEQFANSVESIATQYGTSLAPLGPIVAGLGGDIRFFEGS
jgi:hypothetical protein